jgi:hypothetical protein
MISSEEFQQKLQSGDVHAALALLVRDGAELDITTQIGANITTDRSLDRSTNQAYLRTKINLLTGSVQNEVGANLAIDSPDYLQLHQLHLDRMAIGHQMIQGYQDSLKEILRMFASSDSSSSLPMKMPQQEDLDHQLSGSNHLNPIAEDIDLSIVHEGEIWEEWIEEGIASLRDSSLPVVQTSSSVAPDQSELLTRRQLHPIDVKPMMPRQSKSIETSASWSQFVPEHLGISAEL